MRFGGLFQPGSGPRLTGRLLSGLSAVVATCTLFAGVWFAADASSKDGDAEQLAYDGQLEAPSPSPEPSDVPDADESDPAPQISAPSVDESHPDSGSDASQSPSDGADEGQESEDAGGSGTVSVSRDADETDDTEASDGSSSGSGSSSGGSGTGSSASGSSGSGSSSGSSGSGSSGSTGGSSGFSSGDQAGTGDTFYVDLGARSGGDGSVDNPYSSLDAVFNGGQIESRNWTSFPANGNGSLTTKNAGAPINAGDTIVLAGGNYGNLQIRGYYNTQPITITSAQGQRATFSHISVSGGAGWVLDSLTVTGGGSSELVDIEDHGHHGPTSDVTIQNSTIQTVANSSGWSASDWNNRALTGVQVKAESITIAGNTIRNVEHGISLRGDDQVVRNNSIDRFAGDGIRLVGTSNSRYIGNRISNAINVNDNHDDGFQHFPPYDNPSKVTTNVVIRNNTVINCEGTNALCGPLQGIVTFDGRSENWTVEGNTVVTNHWHGISLYNIHNSTVRNNVVRDPNQIADIGPTWLRIANRSSNVVVECNVAASFVSTEGNSNVTMRNNTTSNAASARPPSGC
ncbi:nitrous oxide reductase family maturation protein NosD [uncultured Demequina sp.]|uniref:right-handed parallel beta-helix repeat-containing protein n=1 Tax=uncultured Demequina sp. TaxID=693499 RepID=UPI0026012F77|nr:right-handed parallel beta-helix repeat-containing protein [uncultured Demequina sp.]